ncbi:hypothetical protein V6N12_067891 [Hibiscus sabdariffa]|uniref:Uncharacterized protein n=1 Tax=Hibiscus sabdariffa TaxID=183260 RepID=A0ABR2FNH3_9ROSI
MPNEWHTPLEVPGNRLPETGSRWKLLNVRGSRTLRKEAVLKQLRMKKPRMKQKKTSAEKRTPAEILGRGRKGKLIKPTIGSE